MALRPDNNGFMINETRMPLDEAFEETTMAHACGCD